MCFRLSIFKVQGTQSANIYSDNVLNHTTSKRRKKCLLEYLWKKWRTEK